MTRSRLALLLLPLALLVFAAPLPAQAQEPDPWIGTFQGTLDARGTKLEIALHFAKGEGGYTGTLDSLSQGAEGIPLSRILIRDFVCTADVNSIGATIAVQLRRDKPDRLVGKFAQRGVSMDTELHRVDAVKKPNRPQEPKPPFPYRSEEVAFHHDPARSLDESFGAGAAKEGITLAGTLTLPEGDGPFAAAVMITGSGPQDRDETILGHKPFLVLADALTRAGCAVLRVDDRGTGKSTGSFRGSTSADFARDALAAVRYLQTRPEIDRRRIGLIGHSEGGLIAPMVAAGDGKDDVAFAVLIAPPGVPLGDVIVHQSRLIAAAEGLAEADRKADDELTVSALRIVQSVEDPEQRTKSLTAATKIAFEAMSPTARVKAGGSLEALLEQTKRMDTPWMRFLVARDPVQDLQRMTCPTLVLFGGKDLQVDPAQNEPPLRKAFADGGKVEPTIVVLDGHNHLFQHTETGKPSEYGTIEETFSPAALDVVREWIAKHVVAEKG